MHGLQSEKQKTDKAATSVFEDEGMEMEKNEKTKYKLAEAMKECMKTSKVDAITVKQLAEKCGLTRQTFYRNFLDKFDLINWYFGKILDQSFEHMGRETSVYDALVRKFTYIEQEKQFFAAAFCYDEQNSLREHDFELILAFYENLIQEKIGCKMKEEMHDLLEMYCRSSVYMTVKWVLGKKMAAPEGLAELMVEAMPVKLKELFEKLDMVR